MSVNVTASVLARLKNVAKANGLVYNDVLLRYGIERVLKRLAESEYASKCILKGGTLFILWDGGFNYRPTMDADLEFRGDASPENLQLLFINLARQSSVEDDGFRIDESSVRAESIREDDQYGGVRVTFLSYIGNVRIPLQFDIGIGDAITPTARKAEFPVLLDFSAPIIRVYPKETVIAEKLETIVKRGIGNSRMKDYYDLWMLSKDADLDYDVTRLAIQRTFKRRGTPRPSSLPEGLSDLFAADVQKQIQWKAFLRKSRIVGDELELSRIVSEVRSTYAAILLCGDGVTND